jgi:CheY-like chemotaxis protein
MKNAFVVFIQPAAAGPELAQALKTLKLRSEGFQDPKTFLTRLKEAKPSACIIDMTGKDSPVMIAMIKGIRSVLGAGVPILAVLNKTDYAIRVQALTAGANDVIEKPVIASALSVILSHYIPELKAAALPPIQIEIPPLIKWFFEKISPAMAGLHSALENSHETEVLVQFYAERLAPQRTEFVNMINSLRKSETKADLVQGIRMYGLRNTKQLVVASQLSDVTGAALLHWHEKTGVLTAKPSQIIQYATKTVEKFGEDSRYAEVAFNSGLILDLLFVLAESAETRKTVIRKFLQDRYEQALKDIDRCFLAGKKAESLALEQHIITAILMREAGKVAMAIYFPDYLEVKQKLDRKVVGPVLRHIVEMNKFAVSHNLIGSLICQGAPGLGDAYKSVLFLDYPFMLRDVPEAKDAYELIAICQAVG